jgi:hypothetical protein
MSNQSSMDMGNRVSSQGRDSGLPAGNTKGFKGKGASARRRD